MSDISWGPVKNPVSRCTKCGRRSLSFKVTCPMCGGDMAEEPLAKTPDNTATDNTDE